MSCDTLPPSQPTEATLRQTTSGQRRKGERERKKGGGRERERKKGERKEREREKKERERRKGERERERRKGER